MMFSLKFNYASVELQEVHVIIFDWHCVHCDIHDVNVDILCSKADTYDADSFLKSYL